MMIIVKFFVSFVSINVLFVCLAEYCEICANHTLCKYNTPGPSPECQSYDSTALLSSNDITQLVNKINDRRNFVAMGYSKLLPQAANMKKIHWSTDLATFAQRWVDQCDPFIRPDREDECRDLETSLVGQSIASVAGPAPGLSVRSFVETWFMQVLDYTGSVTYYNQSRDYRTNYFTQLIWADTESIGCGKAKFYVEGRNMMLERLVCNFAPKGNTHGKPVYVIGYAATQCPNNMGSDDQLKGLCVYEDHGNLRKLQTPRPPVSSLLRILNLSNNSVKQEIDPIRSNLKQINFNSSNSKEQRNQRTRHVFSNNTYSALKRIPLIRKQNFWKSLVNITRSDDDYLYQQERGHSHVYHGHDTLRHNYGPIKEENTNQDVRGYHYTTEALNSYTSKDYRNYYNQYHQCTRQIGPRKNDCTTSATNCAINHCTRGITQCQETSTCQPTFREIPFTNPVENHIVPHDLCPCTKTSCPTAPTNCNCNLNCRCLSAPCPKNSDCFTTPCPRIHRMQDDDFKDDTRKSGTFQYDDMVNIVVRSGNKKPNDETPQPKDVVWASNSRMNKSFRKLLQSKSSKQVKDGIDRSRYEDADHDYLYRPFESSIRKRRQFEEQINPLWDINEYNYKKLPQLKSIKYTTLGRRKNKKNKKNMGTLNLLIGTEPITIKLTETFDENIDDQPHVTDKYLSFEELMHLRKLSDGYGDYDHRRAGAGKKTTIKKATTKKATTKKGAITKATTKKATTTKATTKKATIQKPTTEKVTTQKGSTQKATAIKASASQSKEKTTETEFTTNTQFKRISYCTRKLTCTWTAATASDGSMVAPGGGLLGAGTINPPGYVPGCSRTSTCTRVYMNRNKMPSSPSDSFGSGDVSVPDDEDYCERRSLNVQRRNLDDKEVAIFTSQQEDNTDKTLTENVSTISDLDTATQTEPLSETHDCDCNEQSGRRKRQEHSQRQFSKRSCGADIKKDFSYSDLYYLILNKVIRAQKDRTGYQNKECQCNSNRSATSENTCLVLLITISCHAYVFRFMKYLLNYCTNKCIRY